MVGEATALATTASAPTNTTLDITVEEDSTGDGTVDASQTVSVPDGTNTASLSGFTASDAGQYRLSIAASTTEDTASPSLDTATVKTAVTDAGSITASTTAPTTAATTGRETDAGSVTATTGTPTTAQTTARTTDAGSVTPSIATPTTTSALLGIFEGGSVTTTTAAPLTGSETGTTVDAGSTTATTTSPTSARTRVGIIDTGSVTTSTTTPVVGRFVLAEPGSITTSTTTVLGGDETGIGADAGSVTASTTTPTIADAIGSGVIDPGSVTGSGAYPLTSPVSVRTGDELVITDYINQGELVDPVLAQLDTDDASIEFPAGEYKLGSFQSRSDGIELFAPDGDVTLDIVGSGDTMLDLSGDGWRVEGFEFDFRNRASTQTPKQIRATGSGWTVRNCVWRGRMGWPDARPSQAISARVDYNDGQSLIRGCYFQDGSTAPTDAGYGSAIRILPGSVGTTQIQRSWFEGWADPAIDAADSPGPVSIAECYLHNTNEGVRVNAPAEITVSTIVNDGDSPTGARTGRDTMRASCAGNVPASAAGGEVYIEDCDFDWTTTSASDAGHPVDDLSDGSVDSLLIYASRFHNETPPASIAIGGGSVDLRALEVSGSADVIRQTGGIIGDQDITTVSAPAADDTPPIPAPPADGTTPTHPVGSTPSVGQSGGSSGRFYDV